jgi:hypothetical protein
MIDGKSLLRAFRQILNEEDTSDWLDDFTSYRLMHKAAIEFTRRTECLLSSQEITTVTDQVGYTLDADFLKLYLKDNDENHYIKFNDGSSNHFIKYRDYGKIIRADNTTSASIPDYFSLRDDPILDSQATGTCTIAGALSAGQAVLTDGAGDFSDVSPGDIVHNTTDDAMGVVLSKTSNTVLVTAMFDGTDNDWDSSDAYVIQPQGRIQLILDPPPSGSDTVTVHYIQRPDPVYSDYGVYRFQPQYTDALAFYAAWLYKYRDREANFGDRFYHFFELEVKRGAGAVDSSLNRKGWTVKRKVRRTR